MKILDTDMPESFRGPSVILSAIAQVVADDAALGQPVPVKKFPDNLPVLKTYQRMGLAEMQRVLRERICERPQTQSGASFHQVLSALRRNQCLHLTEAGIANEIRIVSGYPKKADIDRIIDRTMTNHDLPEALRERYHDVYGAILDQMRTVRQFRKEQWSGADAYNLFFHREPHGDVQCISGPLSVYLRMNHPVDYAAAYYGVPAGQQTPKHCVRQASRSAGMALRRPGEHPLIANGFTAENNAAQMPFAKWNIDTYWHEEQHVLNRYFQIFDIDPLPSSVAPKPKTAVAPDEHLSQRTSAGILRRLWAELRAKDEILAQMRSFSSVSTIEILLQQRGNIAHYDFPSEVREFLRDRGFLHRRTTARSRMVKDNVTHPYHHTVTGALRAVETLQQHSRYEKLIPELLLIEPLERWEHLPAQTW